MGVQGTAVLDFGAFPGQSDATVAVTGQASILVTSLAEAWLIPVDSADHKADEHLVETLQVFAYKIVAGTGFTIFGCNTSNRQDPLGVGTRIYGKWNVAWVWN